jgi:hypothetical protein
VEEGRAPRRKRHAFHHETVLEANSWARASSTGGNFSRCKKTRDTAHTLTTGGGRENTHAEGPLGGGEAWRSTPPSVPSRPPLSPASFTALDEEWEAFNPDGFKYGLGGKFMRHDADSSQLSSAPAGGYFVNRYSTSAITEDKAEVRLRGSEAWGWAGAEEGQGEIAAQCLT